MNKNVDKIYEFLGEEGFRPKYDDGNIILKYEGDRYLIRFREEDEDYVAITKIIGIDFSEDKILNIYKLINKINYEYILGKCSVREDEESILILEVADLGTVEDFKNNFERYMSIISQMESDFAEGYQEIKS